MANQDIANQSAISVVITPIRWRLIISCIIEVVGAVAGVVPFIAVAELGLALLTDQYWLDPWTIAIITALAMLLRIICLAASAIVTHLADLDMQLIIRQKMAGHLAKVPLGWFTEHHSGFVKKALQDDVQTMHHLVAHSYTSLTVAIVTPITSIIYLVYKDWLMALVALLPIFVSVVLYRLRFIGFREKLDQYNESLRQVNSAVIEYIRGISVVKTFGQSDQAFSRYTEKTEAFIEKFWLWVRNMLGLASMTDVMLSSLFAIFFIVLGSLILLDAGMIEPAQILPALVLAPGLTGPVLILSFTQHELMMGKEAATRIKAILTTPTLPPVQNPKMPENSRVVFDNVTFSYTGKHNAVHDVSFIMEPGTVNALVGPSGSGKSTLAKLLPRFWDPDQGNILIGQVSVKDILPEILYQHVGCVFQDVQLLDTTIAANIALGRPQATEDDIIAAAQSAHIHDKIISLEDGYQTLIGKGTHLSGGEAQRVSIARMLLADTPVIVLDEATAFADPDSEDAIQRAIANLAKNRTLLVIAHRLRTIQGADQIGVMQEGRLIEAGKHQDLLSKNGLYAALWKETL